MDKKVRNAIKRIFIAGIMAFALIMLTSCIKFTGISGSGIVMTEDRKVESFNKISVNAGVNLFISQGGSEEIKIVAEDNIIPLLITEVRNGRLEIHYKQFLLTGLNLNKPVNVYVTIKELNDIDVASGARVKSGEINAGSLGINLSSGASAELNIQGSMVTTSLSSGSLMRISGKTDMQKINLSSGSSYDALDFISKSAVIAVSSGSSAKVNVSDSLDVNISSGSMVQYKGSPKITSNISSGGTLKKID